MVIAAELKAQNAEAEAKARALLIEQMKFTIAKLRHEQYGQSSERGAILEQLELRLADLEEDASEAEAQAQLTAAAAAAAKIKVEGFERKRPARRPLPDHLPRERLVHPAPTACSCCGSTALRKIGEDRHCGVVGVDALSRKDVAPDRIYQRHQGCRGSTYPVRQR